MEFNSFFKSLKAIKPMQWLMLFIFLCVGLSLVLNQTPASHSSDEEVRISAILSAIDGAGKTQIAVFYQTSDEAKTSLSQTAQSAVPVGAVIVSEGASDIGVRLNLIRATRTLLGLSEDAVEVFSMSPGKKE